MQLIKVNSKSGNITEAGYNEKTGECHVFFRGSSEYAYECPPELWNKFKNTFEDSANSTGTFFHQNIKNLPSRRVK